MFENQKSWFESTSFNSMKDVLSTSPGKIGKLINQLFIVTSPFDLPQFITSKNRDLYRDVWKPGHGGIVRLITFGSAADWTVHVEYLGHSEIEFLNADEVHIPIPIQQFLIHTMPMEDMEYPDIELMGETAVNDDQY